MAQLPEGLTYHHLRRTYTLTVDVQRTASGHMSVVSVAGLHNLPPDALLSLYNTVYTELLAGNEDQ